MRFAGSAVENYLGGGPNMGALTQNSAKRDAEHQVAGYRSTAKVGGTGARQLGETLAADAVGAAQANLAGAQANAQMMSSIGSLGGQLIGGLGSMGGGAGGGMFGGTSATDFNFNPSTSFIDPGTYSLPSYDFSGLYR